MTLKKTYLLDAARALKKALMGTTKDRLGDHLFSMAYEGRKLTSEEDYPALLDLARGKSCIYDVGANIGRTALLLSTVLNPNGEIIAFEASESACRILIENIQLNGLSKVIFPINAIIAETSGKVIDFFWEYTSGGATTISGYLGHHYPIKKVTLSLDDFFLGMNKVPDFIKIDVEGAEQQVLLGMSRILSTVHPILTIEIHSWDAVPLSVNASGVFQILKLAGYSMLEMHTGRMLSPSDILEWKGFRRFVIGIPSHATSS